MSSQPADAPVPAPATTRLVIASIAVLLLLAALDQTIVSTALPTIVSDLGGLDHLSWVVTAYLLTSTVVAPLYGKLGDLYGRRLMVFISVALFLLGSVLCGMAQSMEFLIFSRALQGLGGGGLFVLALSIVGDVVAPRDRGRVQGVFAAVFSLSSVIGPLIGGWFVEIASWHWIFYINLPLGLAAVLGFAYGFAPRGARASHRIDWAGAAALSVALAALTLATSLGGRSFGWTSAPAIGLFTLALFAAAAFVVIERRAAEPILPLGLFSSNVFRNATAVGFVSGVCMLGSATFLPLYLQIAKGLSPTMSGLTLVPMTIGVVISSNLAGRYMTRTGRYRILPQIGLSLLALASFGLWFLSAETGLAHFGALILLYGLGMGCIMPVVTTAVQNAVAREDLGTATAAGVMFRQIGGSLGVAVFGALFASRLASGLGPEAAMAASGELGPAMIAQLDPATRDLVATGVSGAIHPIYWITAALALIGLIFAWALQEIPLRNRAAPAQE